MEHWTILLITILSGPFENEQMALLYENYDACVQASPEISDTLPYDHTTICEETIMLSASIVPPPRPKGVSYGSYAGKEGEDQGGRRP